MKHDVYKKMLAFVIVLLLFGLTVVPATNAVNIKIRKTLVDKNQTPINSKYSPYKLLIISALHFFFFVAHGICIFYFTSYIL